MSARSRPLAPLVVVTAAAALGLVAPGAASAHIDLTSHVSRHGKAQQKVGPCGAPSSTRGDSVYTYASGEVLTIAWNEYVDHPGHYRVAFDDDGDDDFVDPASADDRYTNDAVLLELDDEVGVHDYAVDVALPELECEACTIQVVQVMTDKPPFGDGNDLYYHCIDVRLRIGGGPNTGDAAAGGCGCVAAAGASGGGVLALVFALGLVGLRRRRGPA